MCALGVAVGGVAFMTVAVGSVAVGAAKFGGVSVVGAAVGTVADGRRCCIRCRVSGQCFIRRSSCCCWL